MKHITQHSRLVLIAGLLVILSSALVFAQTPNGTKIDNDAKGMFHYANGQPDSVRSNLVSVIVQAPGKLTLSKTASSSNILAGDTVLYRIIARNTGGSILTQVKIVDTLSSKLSFISTTRGLLTNGVVVWNIDSLKQDKADTMFLKARILSTVPNNTYIWNYVFGLDGIDGTIVDSARIVAQSVIDYSCRMGITVTPKMVIGNGTSAAVIEAFLSDSLGNPKPDGTPVYFKTSLGFFSNNKDSVVGYTVGGWVKDSIRALIVERKIFTAIAVVSTHDANICSKLDTLNIIFYPGAIAGMVVDDDNDKPVAGAQIVATSSTGVEVGRVTTREDGRYLIPVPQTDNYRVTMIAKNVLNQIVTASTIVSVNVPGIGGLPPVLQNNLTTGTMYFVVSGKPIVLSGLKLFLNPIIQTTRDFQAVASDHAVKVDSAVTDSMGIYRFYDLAVGTYEVVLHDSRMTATRTVHVLNPGVFIINSNCPIIWNPNLLLTKNGPVNATTYDTVTYTISVQNVGKLSLTNAQMIDTLDQSMKYSRSSNGGVYEAAGHRVVWSIGKLDSLSSARYTVGVTFKDTTVTSFTALNRVWLTSDETTPILAQAQTRIFKANPRLTMTKSASKDTVEPRMLFHYIIRLKNEGNVRLTNVSLTDTINTAFLTPLFVKNGQLTGNVVTWSKAAMDTASVDSIDVLVQVNQNAADDQQVNNIVYARSDETSQAVLTAKAAVYIKNTTIPQTTHPLLSLVKTASADTILVGNEVTYTIRIRNIGDVTLTNVRVTDTLAQTLVPVSTFNAQRDGQVVSYHADSLIVGQTDTVIVHARVLSNRPNKEIILNRAFGQTNQTPLQDTLVQIATRVVVSNKSCRIHLLAVPSILLGDGIKNSRIEAFLTDTLGNPKPDGTPVFFKSPTGMFSNGLDSIVVPTIKGYAVDSLRADVSGIGTVETFVKISATDEDICSAVDSIKVIFYPGAIEGIVIDNRTNLPVEHALVEVLAANSTWKDSTRTPADGSYFILVPKTDTYRVRITITDTFRKVITSESRVYVHVPSTVKNTNFISGKVYFIVSNKPIIARYVKVLLQKIMRTGSLSKSAGTDMMFATTDSTTTDSTGTYMFPVDSITIAQTSTFRIITADRYAQGSIDVTDMTFGKYVINANIPIDLKANIVLTKTANKSLVYVKDLVTYTILLADTGNYSTSNTLVVDSLGTGMSLVSASSSPAGIPIDTSNRRLIRWNVGILDSLGGARDSIKFTVTVRFDDSISANMNSTNSVIFTSNEASRLTAQASTDVIVPQLQITKEAMTKIVNIGDVAAYKITVTNKTSMMTLRNIQVADYIPLGFKYIAGSTMSGSRKIADPLRGKEIRWTIADSLKTDSSIVFVYRLVAGAGAAEGNGINTAQAFALTPSGQGIQSIRVSERVEVRKGIFSDHGLILGKVFYDINRNAYQDPDEPGVKGVEMMMEDGTRIVTGDGGKYSLPDVLPGMHVIKVRKHTLPKGAELILGYNDFAGDPSSRFVHVTPAGIARADFYLALTRPDTVALYQSLAKVGTVAIQRIVEPRNVVFIEDERPALMKLAGVNFDIAKATLRPEAFPTLKQFAEILKEYPDITATIIGHTDSSPIKTKEFANNAQLSIARAKSVKTYLASAEQIDTSRISTLGFGETQPIATNKTKEGKAANRRVEFSFSQQTKPIIRTTQTTIFKLPIRYSGSTAVTKIEMKDVLDERFQFVEGSATLGDSLITPNINGTSLEWTIKDVGTNFNKTLIYRVVIQKPENKLVEVPSYSTSFRYYTADSMFTSNDTLHTTNKVAVATRGRAVNYVLSGVLFDVAKASLRSSALSALWTTAEALKGDPSATALVEGHTDSHPIHTAEFPSNNELSAARARTIVNRLVRDFGIDSTRLRFIGFGSSRPVETNATSEGRQSNRRVEIRILTRAFIEQMIPEGFVNSSAFQRMLILPKYTSVKFDSSITAKSGDRLILQLHVRRAVTQKTLETIVIDSLPAGVRIADKPVIATRGIDSFSTGRVVSARFSAADSIAAIFIPLDVVAPIALKTIEENTFYVVRKERHGETLVDKARTLRIDVIRNER